MLEVSMTYEEFYGRIIELNQDDFAEFCHRYQRIFFRMYRATTARPGDLGNDGIVSIGKRVACYAFYRDTIDKDGGVASKLKRDFDSMMTKHPRTSCMVFMTKTQGIGPKTQRMLEKLQKREYQKELLMEAFPEKYELITRGPKRRIQYVDIKDMFERLRDIIKGETWEFLLNHKLWVQPPAELPRKDLDDPAFMSEWLSAAVRRYDNTEAPAFLKHKELVILRESLEEKMKRDVRKYDVSSNEDIPYDTWLLIGTPLGFSPFFDVPKGFYNQDDEVLKMELTPLILLKTVDKMMRLIETYHKRFTHNDPLFTDLFLQARASLEYEYAFKMPSLIVNRKKWQMAFANYVRE